jgi:RHS repeat-associated protein
MNTLKKLLSIVGLWLAVSMATHAGTVTYIYTDNQGTPLAEADAQGNVTATFDYRPYGAQALGTPPKGPGYTGHVNDPDTGLVYMQARYYDPQIGRFLSVDPVTPNDSDGNNFNRYRYASGNPYKFTDPDGRQEYAAEKLSNSYAKWTPQERAPFEAVVVPITIAIVASTPVVGPELATVLRTELKQPVEQSKSDATPETDSTIYRMGNSKESGTRLSNKAADAESKIGTHGVSGSTNKPSGPCSSASCSRLKAAGFPVRATPTKADAGHVTIEMPKPVTKEVADDFNKTRGR